MAEIIVTGASRGIGRELAAQLSARGDKVITPLRNPPADLPQLLFEVHEGFDIASDKSVEEFAKSLEGRQIDVLINNAAIFVTDDWRTIDFGTTRMQFEVNALGPIRLSKALLSNFHQGSKIVMISSRSGSIGMASSDDNLSYRMSKAALNMASRVLANGVKARGITVVSIHPGSVATRMNEEGELSPAESARGIISLIDRINIEATGTFWHVDGAQLPW